MPNERESAKLRKLAQHAREVARAISDKDAIRTLLHHAEEYDAEAAALEAQPTLPAAAAIASGEPPIAHAGAALKPETASLPEPEPAAGARKKQLAINRGQEALDGSATWYQRREKLT